MVEIAWTPLLVEERLANAANTLKRMPPVTVQGYFSAWPKIVYEFSDLVGQEPPFMRRPCPSPAAISRMEQTLSWTVGLDPLDAKIVWLRAYGHRWKYICARAGLSRTATHLHWLYGLCVIAWKLNGAPIGSSWSREKLIALTPDKHVFSMGQRKNVREHF